MCLEQRKASLFLGRHFYRKGDSRLINRREKPHLILFFILAILSGLSYAVGPSSSDALTSEVPQWLQTSWAVSLFLSGAVGLWWHLGGVLRKGIKQIRSMMAERGALQIQAATVLMYGGVLVAYAGWRATLSAGLALAWAGSNLWESYLIRRDVNRSSEPSK